MNTLKNILITMLSFIFLSGCDSTIEPDNSGVGFTYFPLEKGLFKVYDSEVIAFTILGFDTTNFQLKEIVADSFLNASNDYTYVLNRYIRITEQDDWEIDSVWSARRTTNQLIVTENNIPYAKLSFPIKNELKWDGNTHNAKAEDLYSMKNIRQEKTINGEMFETLTVVQGDEKTLVKKDERHETYAENVGLVEKTLIKVDYISDSQDAQYGKDIIVGGRSFKLSLIDHGKE